MNRIRPFIPTEDIECVIQEIGNVQKLLMRWARSKEHWGPRLWYYIHNTCAYYVRHGPYTPNQIECMVEWVKQIILIIPCRRCKYWYRKYVLTLDINTACNDANTLFDFMVDIHNKINTKLGKPVHNITASDFF